jgi:hypothetical protein
MIYKGKKKEKRQSKPGLALVRPNPILPLSSLAQDHEQTKATKTLSHRQP